MGDGGGFWARRELARLKSMPRRSWTGGASRAGGRTGKGGHEGNAKGVHEGGRGGRMRKQEGWAERKVSRKCRTRAGGRCVQARGASQR